VEDEMVKLIGKAFGAAAHLAWYLTYRAEGHQRSRPMP
jgi:hypothetical protein